MALDALDRAICAVLGCDKFKNESSMVSSVGSKGEQETEGDNNISDAELTDTVRDYMSSSGENGLSLESESFEYAVISPLRTLYSMSQNAEVRACALKILLHVLEVSYFGNVYVSYNLEGSHLMNRHCVICAF